MTRHFALKTLLQKITNHKEHEINKGCAFCKLHLKFCWQNLSAKCKTLNLKPCELHLHPILTLIPKPQSIICQNALVMHWIRISQYAYMNTSIYQCPNRHSSQGNSCRDMHEHWLLHEHFMPNMYKDEYVFLKIGYEYMHIMVLFGFISNFFTYPGNTSFNPIKHLGILKTFETLVCRLNFIIW